ncbi:hypothetical protein NBRC116589_14010 [Ruegeria sp. HU-ET01832]
MGFVEAPNHCALKVGARQTKIRHIQYARTVLNFEVSGAGWGRSGIAQNFTGNAEAFQSLWNAAIDTDDMDDGADLFW